MSKRPQPVRGMRDTLPSESKTRRQLLDTIVSTYESFGFDQVDTPIVEELSRLVDSDAGENDKLIFKILRRNIDWETSPGSDSEVADLGLRYDLTVPLARYFATNEAELPSPFKALQVGPVFRAERPQRGRYRQFTQCDIDVFRAEPVVTEIELIAATNAALQGCGVDGFSFRVNDRRVLDEILRRSGVADAAKAAALIALDKLDKIGDSGVRSELDELQPGLGAALFDALAGFDASTEDVARELRDIVACLQVATDAKIRIDLSLVRGMGYYTGPIFEIEHGALGMSLGGGGRYDGMVERISGIDATACGISIGFERLCLLMEGRTRGSRTRVALLVDKSSSPEVVLATTLQVRAQGYDVRTERAVKNRKAQLLRLAASGYTHYTTGDGEIHQIANDEGDK